MVLIQLSGELLGERAERPEYAGVVWRGDCVRSAYSR